MIVPSLHNALLSNFVSSSPAKHHELANSAQKNVDSSNNQVALSESAQQLMKDFMAKKTLPVFKPIPVEQRPTAQQNADTILGFIGQNLEKRATQGATQEQLENTLNQALKGFMKGFTDAFKVIKSLGLMTNDVRQSLSDTKSLVLSGLDTVRESYLGSDNTEQAPKVATTNSNTAPANSTVQTAAALYTQNYQRNETVELAVKTRDGDRVTLSFSSNFAASSSISAFLRNTEQATSAIQTYQSNVSESARFNFSVQGDLDAGEIEALNRLLEQVAGLTDEFFNGDFDTALSLASEFDLNTEAFSALSLDIARSTSASVAQAYVASQSLSSDEATPAQALTGLDVIGQMLDKLTDLAQSARSFNEPKNLLSELLANQVAQQSLTAPGFNTESVARLLDTLLGQLA